MSDNSNNYGRFPDEDDSEMNDDGDNQSDGGFSDKVELDMRDFVTGFRHGFYKADLRLVSSIGYIDSFPLFW